MTIDVIDNYDEISPFITGWQLYRIQRAQLKKNALIEELSLEMKKAKAKLIQNGTFVSELLDAECARLQEKYDEKIDILQREIKAYLDNSMRHGFAHGFTVPYVINLALSQYQRYLEVKAYYLKAYPNANERLNAYLNDPFAVEYIKDYHKHLHTEFLDDV